MSVSHHDREEETLIAYFQQMLADVDDQEFDGELQAQGGDLYAAPVKQSAYTMEEAKRVINSANEAIRSTHESSQYYEVPSTKSSSLIKDGSLANAKKESASLSSSYGQNYYQEFSTHNQSSHSVDKDALVSVAQSLSQEPRDLISRSQREDDLSSVSMASIMEQDRALEQAIERRSSQAMAPKIDSSLEKTSDSELERSLERKRELEPQLQMQLAPQSKIAEKTLDFATPSDSGSLQRLLATVETHTETETKVEPKVETKVETKVVAPTPKVEPKVETKAVAPAPKVEIKVEAPAPKVVAPAPKVETKVQSPVVAPKTVSPSPAVSTKAQVAATKQQAKAIVKTPQQLAQERMAKKLEGIAAEWKNVDLGEQFQVLFFLVQGVRFAVPLIDLGGIFECDKITQLFGKPSWFMGITDVRGDKINIVDTLRWVMPEINDSPDKYPYLISLGNTEWSIGCDVLEGNRTLNKSQIKWREIPGNRPWLAGIVTSDKCAVLHVQSLIALFEAGADIEDLNKNLKSEKDKK